MGCYRASLGPATHRNMSISSFSDGKHHIGNRRKLGGGGDMGRMGVRTAEIHYKRLFYGLTPGFEKCGISCLKKISTTSFLGVCAFLCPPESGWVNKTYST